MGRKKSIANQLSCKSLSQARQQLRDIEKQMIAEALQEAGQLILGVFKEDPDATVFANNPQLSSALGELQQVAGKRLGLKVPPATSQPSPPEDVVDGVESASQTLKNIKPRPGYEPVHFVADVPDREL